LSVLLVKPSAEVWQPVEDAAADLEALWTDAEVPPPALFVTTFTADLKDLSPIEATGVGVLKQPWTLTAAAAITRPSSLRWWPSCSSRSPRRLRSDSSTSSRRAVTRTRDHCRRF